MTEGPTKVKPQRPPSGRRPGEVACLEMIAGKSPGKTWPLTEGNGIIGRTSRAQVQLEDDGVSREHAKLVTTDEGFVNLVDLGSTNGTFLNGGRVDVAVVREGDRIEIGPDVTLRFGYATPNAGTATDEPAEPPIELSPRELEVAKLVAEGLTNAEVAGKLHISPYTVMTHLSNAYARIGVKSRTALAKLVAEGRLVAKTKR